MAEKELYKQLVAAPVNVIGDQVPIDDKEAVVKTINTFLKEYPKTLKPAPAEPWIDLPVRDLFVQSIETAIKIIEDISALLSQREQYTSAEYRRQFVHVFMQPQRRVYVGLWLIFISFMLYFIDSAA